jgi:O-antigen/teichoic acid export membrane protein
LKNFIKHAFVLFLALRAGDLVSITAGMWFVPRYVSPEDIGAVLPITSFATFLSLPIFALAMTVMKESACLSSNGERGKIKSLLKGIFLTTAAILGFTLAATALSMPIFLNKMRIDDSLAGFLVVASAFLGCCAPVWTDALQSLKRFTALAVIEVTGSVFRFATMVLIMPLKALAGFFAAQASLPAFRIVAGAFALRRDLAVPAEPYWNHASIQRLTQSFLAILAYQGVPLFVSMMEQSLLRSSLPAADSAGYYMITRFSDFLFYLTFPLLLVMFPYTATAAQRGESTAPYVVKCSAATMIAASAMAAVYTLFGTELLALMPNGDNYPTYARYMPYLTLITALTSCQTFFTNAEVSAGRFGFMKWFVPLHCVYAAALYAGIKYGTADSLGRYIAWFAAIAIMRFIFSAIHLGRMAKRI